MGKQGLIIGDVVDKWMLYKALPETIHWHTNTRWLPPLKLDRFVADKNKTNALLEIDYK